MNHSNAISPAPNRQAYKALRHVLRPAFRAFFAMESSGAERIPRCEPFILAYNHVSMLDWAFVSYFLPEPVRFVVDREYFDRPLLRMPMRINGAIPAYTDRADPDAFRLARAVLADGESIILTPEGRISRTGRPGVGRPGIIALAAGNQVPIVPAAIRGAFEVLPRHRRIPRPGRVTVAFGAPLAPPPRTDRPTQRALVARLMRHIGELLDGAADPPAPW